MEQNFISNEEMIRMLNTGLVCSRAAILRPRNEPDTQITWLWCFHERPDVAALPKQYTHAQEMTIITVPLFLPPPTGIDFGFFALALDVIVLPEVIKFILLIPNKPELHPIIEEICYTGQLIMVPEELRDDEYELPADIIVQRYLHRGIVMDLGDTARSGLRDIYNHVNGIQ